MIWWWFNVLSVPETTRGKINSWKKKQNRKTQKQKQTQIGFPGFEATYLNLLKYGNSLFNYSQLTKVTTWHLFSYSLSSKLILSKQNRERIFRKHTIAALNLSLVSYSFETLKYMFSLHFWLKWSGHKMANDRDLKTCP